MQYRPIPEARLQDQANVAHYAFYPEEGPGEQERIDDPSYQFGDPRALFDGDEIAAVCRLLELDARCRGEWITLGGVRGVATPPEHRRGGAATQLMAEALAEFRDRDVPLVALWPFEHEFYADLGWAPAAKHATYRLPPETLESIATNEAGRLFRPPADEWERLQRVNLADGEGVSLSLRRTENWWRHRVFEKSGTKRHVYAWEHDGEVEGYVVYTVEEDGSDRVLEIEDLATVDDRAFRHLCWLLYNHDSQIDSITMPGDPAGEFGELLDRVRSPESVSCQLDHGAMVRVADVPQALETVQYPNELDEMLVFDVDDDLVDWNDGQFELTFEGGSGQCRPIEGEDEVPDAKVDVGTLSQLAVGYSDVENARRDGDLRIHDEEATEVIQRAFPPRPVELSEFF